MDVAAPPPVEATPLDTATIVSDPTTRYFLIKSYNNDNIGRSLQYGVWATSQRNEKVLSEAYRTSSYVVLVFSVNHSSRFSGFGVMTSEPGQSSQQGKAVFCGPDGTPFPGKMFSVHWITNCEVFFRDCETIVNAFNENKPVKVGRDGQEIDPIAGRRLCLLIDAKQPRHSRPAPLLLDVAVTSSTSMSQHLEPPGTTTRSEGTTATTRLAITGSTSLPKAGLQQLAAIAKFLKKHEASSDPVKREPLSSAAQAVSSNTTPSLPSAAVVSSSPCSQITWDFQWVEEALYRDPILAVFPLDLTEIATYEAYLKVVRDSRTLWDRVAAQYAPLQLPSLPESVRLSPEALKKFDAELLLHLVARSVSQADLDAYLQPLLPLSRTSTAQHPGAGLALTEAAPSTSLLPSQHTPSLSLPSGTPSLPPAPPRAVQPTAYFPHSFSAQQPPLYYYHPYHHSPPSSFFDARTSSASAQFSSPSPSPGAAAGMSYFPQGYWTPSLSATGASAVGAYSVPRPTQAAAIQHDHHYHPHQEEGTRIRSVSHDDRISARGAPPSSSADPGTHHDEAGPHHPSSDEEKDATMRLSTTTAHHRRRSPAATSPASINKHIPGSAHGPLRHPHRSPSSPRRPVTARSPPRLAPRRRRPHPREPPSSQQHPLRHQNALNNSHRYPTIKQASHEGGPYRPRDARRRRRSLRGLTRRRSSSHYCTTRRYEALGPHERPIR